MEGARHFLRWKGPDVVGLEAHATEHSQWVRSRLAGWSGSVSLGWSSLTCLWDTQLEVSSRHQTFRAGPQKRILTNVFI